MQFAELNTDRPAFLSNFLNFTSNSHDNNHEWIATR